jgi:hypothetical protein
MDKPEEFNIPLGKFTDLPAGTKLEAPESLDRLDMLVEMMKHFNKKYPDQESSMALMADLKTTIHHLANTKSQVQKKAALAVMLTGVVRLALKHGVSIQEVADDLSRSLGLVLVANVGPSGLHNPEAN